MEARAVRSASDENRLILGRAEVNGRVMVEEDADDDTDVETRTDITKIAIRPPVVFAPKIDDT